MRSPPGDSAPEDRGEPVFAEPWEARILAMVVALSGRGAFEWKAFQALLVAEIRAGEEHDPCRPYYVNWMRAAERLLETLGLSTRSETDAEVERLRPDDRTVRLR